MYLFKEIFSQLSWLFEKQTSSHRKVSTPRVFPTSDFDDLPSWFFRDSVCFGFSHWFLVNFTFAARWLSLGLFPRPPHCFPATGARFCRLLFSLFFYGGFPLLILVLFFWSPASAGGWVVIVLVKLTICIRFAYLRTPPYTTQPPNCPAFAASFIFIFFVITIFLFCSFRMLLLFPSSQWP